MSYFNRAYIALVPKMAGARRIRDFCPINLINDKIISKVLTCRIKKKISDLINPSQFTFIHRRSI